eukprot:5731010-Pyramimonas_sp.AAC.1
MLVHRVFFAAAAVAVANLVAASSPPCPKAQVGHAPCRRTLDEKKDTPKKIQNYSKNGPKIVP